MKLISKVRIEGFRSIRRAAISELGNFTVFAGLNNSGKSNVLRALNAFFNAETDPGRYVDVDDDLGHGDEYVELDTNSPKEEKSSKVLVRPFVMEDFEDIKEVLDVLREGTTIALVNIKPLKEKDLVELKRAISKLRKTCEAIDGDIAGFGEDYVVAVPYFAKIHRSQLKE